MFRRRLKLWIYYNKRVIWVIERERMRRKEIGDTFTHWHKHSRRNYLRWQKALKKNIQLEGELEMYEGDETFASLAIRVTELEAENDKLVFACKQALMAFEDGYDAPKIRQDLRDALLTSEDK